MISVVKVKYDEVAAGGPARLFRSDQPGLAGRRAAARLHLGRRRGRRDAVAAATRRRSAGCSTSAPARRAPISIWRTRSATPPACRGAVEFIDMPASAARPVPVLHPGADGAAARRRLCAGQFTPLEEGIRRYVQDYLATARSVPMIPVLLFPQFDPVLVQLGPFAHPLVRAGLHRRPGARLAAGAAPGASSRRRSARQLQVDDFLTWATLGVVLGGRLGYVLFYQPSVYLAAPVADLRRSGTAA